MIFSAVFVCVPKLIRRSNFPVRYYAITFGYTSIHNPPNFPIRKHTTNKPHSVSRHKTLRRCFLMQWLHSWNIRVIQSVARVKFIHLPFRRQIRNDLAFYIAEMAKIKTCWIELAHLRWLTKVRVAINLDTGGYFQSLQADDIYHYDIYQYVDLVWRRALSIFCGRMFGAHKSASDKVQSSVCRFGRVLYKCSN